MASNISSEQNRDTPVKLCPGVNGRDGVTVLLNHSVIGIVSAMVQPDEMLTSAEFAALQRVSARRIRALASGGRIAGARKRGRDWLIPTQAKIAAGTRGPASNASAQPSGVRAFKSIAGLDRFQRDREVAMAVRVQAMKSRDRFKWLSASWGALQRQPLAQPARRKASARHFASIAEKNRHDEALEIAAAVARTRAYPASPR